MILILYFMIQIPFWDIDLHVLPMLTLHQHWLEAASSDHKDYARLLNLGTWCGLLWPLVSACSAFWGDFLLETVVKSGYHSFCRLPQTRLAILLWLLSSGKASSPTELLLAEFFSFVCFTPFCVNSVNCSNPSISAISEIFYDWLIGKCYEWAGVVHLCIYHHRSRVAISHYDITDIIIP